MPTLECHSPTRLPAQSRWGITSIACALAASFLYLALWLLILTLGKPGPGGNDHLKLLILTCVALMATTALTGLVTGTLGCLQKTRRRQLAAYGLASNLAALLILAMTP